MCFHIRVMSCNIARSMQLERKSISHNERDFKSHEDGPRMYVSPYVKSVIQ